MWYTETPEQLSLISDMNALRWTWVLEVSLFSVLLKLGILFFDLLFVERKLPMVILKEGFFNY